jgi:hypothetical protein
VANLTLHFRAAEGVDPAVAAADLQQQLSGLPHVTNAETRAEQYRSIGPSEIITGLTLGFALLHESTQVVSELSKLLDAIKQLIKSGKGLHEAFVEIGMRKVPLDQLSQADLETLAKRTTGA